MTSVTVVVPITIRRRGGRKQIIGPEGAPVPMGDQPSETRGDPALVKALARAFRWQRMLEDGRYGSIRELAAAERVDRAYVGRVLNLTLLAPDIVKAILDGKEPEGLTIAGLVGVLPACWIDQRVSKPSASSSAPITVAGQTFGCERQRCRDEVRQEQV